MVPIFIPISAPAAEFVVTKTADTLEITGSTISNNIAGLTESSMITASDALIDLSASVGVAERPSCVCDVNNSGGVNATDALLLIRYAVGQRLTLDCPPCS